MKNGIEQIIASMPLIQECLNKGQALKKIHTMLNDRGLFDQSYTSFTTLMKSNKSSLGWHAFGEVPLRKPVNEPEPFEKIRREDHTRKIYEMDASIVESVQDVSETESVNEPEPVEDRIFESSDEDDDLTPSAERIQEIVKQRNTGNPLI